MADALSAPQAHPDADTLAAATPLARALMARLPAKIRCASSLQSRVLQLLLDRELSCNFGSSLPVPWQPERKLLLVVQRSASVMRPFFLAWAAESDFERCQLREFSALQILELDPAWQERCLQPATGDAMMAPGVRPQKAAKAGRTGKSESSAKPMAGARSLGWRLPGGGHTSSEKVYLREWGLLTSAVERSLGAKVTGFDPQIMITRPDGTGACSLPVWVAQGIAEAAQAATGGGSLRAWKSKASKQTKQGGAA